jgi:hypothetical protein
MTSADLCNTLVIHSLLSLKPRARAQRTLCCAGCLFGRLHRSRIAAASFPREPELKCPCWLAAAMGNALGCRPQRQVPFRINVSCSEVQPSPNCLTLEHPNHAPLLFPTTQDKGSVDEQQNARKELRDKGSPDVAAAVSSRRRQQQLHRSCSYCASRQPMGSKHDVWCFVRCKYV